jgi:hypothetical protein
MKMDCCQETLDPRTTWDVTEFDVPTNFTVNCRKLEFDAGPVLDVRVAFAV